MGRNRAVAPRRGGMRPAATWPGGGATAGARQSWPWAAHARGRVLGDRCYLVVAAFRERALMQGAA